MADVTINGGTIANTNGKDVVTAQKGIIRLSGVSIQGGNNGIYGAGGNIEAANVTISGSSIGINIRNAASTVTLSGKCQILATTHGTAVHVNSGGKLVLSDNAHMVIDATGGSSTVGMKIYKGGSTLSFGAGSKLDAVCSAKLWNTESGHVIEGRENAAITFNGEAV